MLEYQLREEHFLIIETRSTGVRAGSADLEELPKVNIPFEQTNPFRNGQIEDWELLESIWKTCLHELNVKKSRNHSPVLLACPSTISKADRENIAKIFFEKFNVPGLYIGDLALMSLYGYGQHLTGIIVDISHDLLSAIVIEAIIPVIDAITQNHAITTANYGIADIIAYFSGMLTQNSEFMGLVHGGASSAFTSFLLEEVLQVAPSSFDSDHNKQKKETPKADFTFGQTQFSVGEARLRALESLFFPKSLGVHDRSLPELIFASIVKCEIDKRTSLCSNVILLGPFCKVKGQLSIHQVVIIGLKDRLVKEMKKYFPLSDFASDMQPKELKFAKMPEYIETYKEREELSGFIGSMLSAKYIFPDLKNYHSKLDYNEHGPSVTSLKEY